MFIICNSRNLSPFLIWLQILHIWKWIYHSFPLFSLQNLTQIWVQSSENLQHVQICSRDLLSLQRIPSANTLHKLTLSFFLIILRHKLSTHCSWSFSPYVMSAEYDFNDLLLYWIWNQGCAESLCTCLVETQVSWSSVNREIWVTESVVLGARVDK